MSLNKEELREIRHAVNYYRNHFISVSNPRHTEYSTIVDKLSELIKQSKDNEDIYRQC